MNPKFEKVVIVFLLLSTILQTYGWGKYDFSFIITSLLSIAFVLKHGFKSTLPKLLLVYFLYRFIIHVISSTSIVTLVPIGLIKIYMAYIMYFSIRNVDFFVKSYKTIATICIIFFAVQFISYSIFDFRVRSVFSFLPFALEYDSIFDYYAEMDTSDRSSSFFSEPAHFVQFLLPLLAICLFSPKYKNYKYAFILLLTIVLTQSGNGMLGLVVIGIAFLIYLFISNNRAKFAYSVGFGILAGILSVAFLSTDMGDKMLQRSVTVKSNSVDEIGYAGSGYVRIYRGYGVYEAYDGLQKIIGNDNEDYIVKCISRSRVAPFFLREGDLYFNTFQNILLFTGIIGVLLFFIFFYREWGHFSYVGKTVLATGISLSFVASFYLTDTMALYILIPFLFNKERNNNLYYR